ncbi:MAG: hypothetical protein KKG99_15400 [Bacteroidetes bacterium]|nr:hypothetical protein [Bacteroidota bacterium]
MKKIVFSAILIIACGTLFAQQNGVSRPTGLYLGQKLPGDVPELFAPGIVSTGLDELNSVFSPDGSELYFCLRKPTGASIFQMKMRNGIWGKPELLPFASRFGDIDINISSDGTKLFFSSRRPLPGTTEPKKDNDFWMVDRKGNTWGNPVYLGKLINSESEDYFPMVTKNGNLYFSSQREGQGTNNIYRSKLVKGEYSTAEKLDSSINSEFREFDPYVSPDESFIIFASSRPNGFGGDDLYISFRKPDGYWTKARNMGDKINSMGSEYSPMLSPDGKYMFFTGSRRTPLSTIPENPQDYSDFKRFNNSPQNYFSDIYWVDAKIINELK